jgi:hypothetical protein
MREREGGRVPRQSQHPTHLLALAAHLAPDPSSRHTIMALEELVQ